MPWMGDRGAVAPCPPQASGAEELRLALAVGSAGGERSEGDAVVLRPGLADKNGWCAGEVATVSSGPDDDGDYMVRRCRDGEELSYFEAADMATAPKQAFPKAEFVQKFGESAWNSAPAVRKEVVGAKALAPTFLGLDGQPGEEPWRVDRATASSIYGLPLAAAPDTYFACIGWLCVLAELNCRGFVPDGPRLLAAAEGKNVGDMRKLLLVGSDVHFKACARGGRVAAAEGGAW